MVTGTCLLFLCSLLPLTASLSINAGTGFDTGQFLHATLDWKTGILEDVQYQPRYIKGASINAPCFFLSAESCPDGLSGIRCSTLICRDNNAAFSPVCNFNSTLDPSLALLDASREQLFVVASGRDADKIYSMNLTTCGVLWEADIPATKDKEVEEQVFALGLSTDGGQLYGKASGSPDFSFTIDPSTGNISSQQGEWFATELQNGLHYDAMSHQWFGVNTSGPFHDCARDLNMFTVDDQGKETAFETFPIPPSWYPKYCEGGDFTIEGVVLEDGKLHVNVGPVNDDATDNNWNPFVTIDAHTGKLLAAVEIQYPSLKFASGSINPSTTGCPGGTLNACTDLCPSNPPAAYKACVKTCVARCT